MKHNPDNPDWNLEWQTIKYEINMDETRQERRQDRPAIENTGGLTIGTQSTYYQREGMRDVTISRADYGYIVKVGCNQLAISKKEDLIAAVVAYINDPINVERKYSETGKLPPYEQELPF